MPQTVSNFLRVAEGMSADSVTFERGIVLRRTTAGWVAHSATKAPVVVEPEAIARHHRPVLMSMPIGGIAGVCVSTVIHPNGGFVRLLEHGSLLPKMSIPHGAAVHYLTDAMSYHLARLGSAYERVRDRYKGTTLLPGWGSREGPVHFSGQPEPYFEFDALLGVARRAYDSCRYVLWKAVGPAKGSVPRSFERTLPLCPGVSPDVRDDLRRSWETCGAVLTEYRDCIHHYVPVDFGVATVRMDEAVPGVWAAWARIPDNPSARSKSRFTYSKELDALTFGWQVTVEVLRFVRVVAGLLPQTQAADATGRRAPARD